MEKKSPTKKQTLGKQGEDIAAQYLVRNGFKVIERNFKRPYGEIDVVCRETGGLLVIVEVKTVAGEDPWVTAEEQMTSHKMEKFKRIASLYANNYLKNKNDSVSFRLDLITINIISEKAYLRHYKNIS